MLWWSLLLIIAMFMVLHLNRQPKHVCKALEQRRECEDCLGSFGTDTNSNIDSKGARKYGLGGWDGLTLDAMVDSLNSTYESLGGLFYATVSSSAARNPADQKDTHDDKFRGQEDKPQQQVCLEDRLLDKLAHIPRRCEVLAHRLLLRTKALALRVCEYGHTVAPRSRCTDVQGVHVISLAPAFLNRLDPPM